MSGGRHYDDPPAHAAALRQRLKNVYEIDDQLAQRRVRTMANVVVAQMLPSAAVKGGTAMNLRRGPAGSRFSIDLDVTCPREVTEDEFMDELNMNLGAGWEGFTGVAVRRPKSVPRNVPEVYVMLPVAVTLQYRGSSVGSVKLEIAIDEVDSLSRGTEVVAEDVVRLFTSVGLPPPKPVSVVSIEDQFVQKLHACTTPGAQGRFERAHDLVDLQLLCVNEELDLEQLNHVGRRLFAFRKRDQWPPTVVQHEGWDDLYAEASEGLGLLSLPEAVDWVNDIVIRATATSSD